MRLRLVAILALLAAPALAQGASNGDRRGVAAGQRDADGGAARVASGFYRVYLTLHPSDGIPPPAVRARMAPFISTRLARLLIAGADAEARHARATRHQEPPLQEGDLFSSLFEGATAARVGACTVDHARGRCQVALRRDEPATRPTTWTDTVLLTRGAAGWRVDDIAYGGGWDFGHADGRLSTVLRAMVTAADGPRR